MKHRYLFGILVAIFFINDFAVCENIIRIGYVGSLSGFAASYGTAVLDGVRLAVDESNKAGKKVELSIQDDASDSSKTVTAFKSLTLGSPVQGLIGGTWWANSIVKIVEREGYPFLSAETIFDKETILAHNYFIMSGQLKDWVFAFEPLLRDRKLKRCAIVRFISGFGETLAEATKELCSKDGREFLGDLEYQSVQGEEISSLLLKLKSLNPDVVYFDGQPASASTFLRKMNELGLGSIFILSNEIIQTACKENLVDCSKPRNIFYTVRSGLNQEFALKFERHFKRKPILSTDLGYYSTKTLLESLKHESPVNYLRTNPVNVDGIVFKFNSRNVLDGITRKIWSLESGAPKEISN